MVVNCGCELQNIHRTEKKVALTKGIYFRNGSLTHRKCIVCIARNSPRRVIWKEIFKIHLELNLKAKIANIDPAELNNGTICTSAHT